MALKKQQFAEGEIAIFDEACIYKRGEYWQFRMWLPKENKYARKSLPQDGSIEIGHINYSPLLQKTREGTEAMYLMMKWAFESGYRRYEWKCNALNTKSRYAAQRLGLSYEGVFRQMSISKGRNRNTAWFAAIDKEWPALNASFETYLSDDNFAADGRPKKALSGLTKPLLYKRDTFEFGSE